jgi:DNA-binding transcriptional regulator YiaG
MVPDRRHERPQDEQLSAGPHPFSPTLPSGHEGTCPTKNTCLTYLIDNIANIVGGQEGHENQGGISKKITLSLNNIGVSSIFNGMKEHDLTKWRKRWKLTQVKLAQALGVDVMTVSRWERGVQVPTPVLPLALEALEHRMMKGGKDGLIG